MKNNFALIGAGRLGASLGRALVRKGWILTSLSCLTMEEARESRSIIGRGEATTDAVKAAGEGSVVFLTAPDEAVAGLAAELAGAGIDWKGRFAFHCSGILPSSVLDPLKKKGARTGSFHPIQSFPTKRTAPGSFRGITFGVEGGPEAQALACTIAGALEASTIPLTGSGRAAYHAACSISSNLLVSLLDIALQQLETVGISRRDALSVLMPLVQGTLHNVNKIGIPEALSGPIVRGDAESIEKHLKVLEKSPNALRAYRALAAHALEMSGKAGKIDPENAGRISLLLEEK